MHRQPINLNLNGSVHVYICLLQCGATHPPLLSIAFSSVKTDRVCLCVCSFLSCYITVGCMCSS